MGCHCLLQRLVNKPQITESENGREGVETCLRHQSHVKDLCCSDRLSLVDMGEGGVSSIGDLRVTQTLDLQS